MLFYGILATATLTGFLGLGMLSMGILTLAWALTKAPLTDTFPDDPRRWIKHAAQTALIAHFVLIGILVIKVSFVVSNNGEGWPSAFLGHWLLDHIGEALISVWLTYKVIKGGANLHAKKSPTYAGLAPSSEMES